MALNNCVVCNKQIKPRQKNHSYCSKSCRQKAHYIRHRQESKDKLNAQARAWWKLHANEISERRKLKYTQNKIKILVRQRTIGNLGKPKICVLCRKTKNLQWHHYYYDKPDSWKDCVGACRMVCHPKLDKERREKELIINEVLG